MTPYLSPKTARLHQYRTIELQCAYSSATNRSQTKDIFTAQRPCKMLVPLLLARIEYMNQFKRHRVNNGNLVAFMPVALRTSKPKITFFVRSTQ